MLKILLLQPIVVWGDPMKFRPPAVPLIVQDPYISIWSQAADNKLATADTTHWIGDVNTLFGMVKLEINNGPTYCFRWMGKGADRPLESSRYSCHNAMSQTGVVVNATNTYFTFEEQLPGCGKFEFRARFNTPAFMKDFAGFTAYEMMALPLTFLQFSGTAECEGTLSVYFDHTSEMVAGTDSLYKAESVTWDGPTPISKDSLWKTMSIGNVIQNFANSGGDRITWGKFHSVSSSEHAEIQSAQYARLKFAGAAGMTPPDFKPPRRWNDGDPVLSTILSADLKPGVTATMDMLVGMEEDVGFQYFGYQMPPWWRKSFATFNDMLKHYVALKDKILAASEAFDLEISRELLASCRKEDIGKKYDRYASLVYRQVTGAHKLVWNNKINDPEPWIFQKEISSDADISTVDVVFPSSPIFLTLNPKLLTRVLLPLLAYANNETAAYGAPSFYSNEFSPHDLGTWPIGGAGTPEWMPVEESSGMIMMLAGILQQVDISDMLLHYEGLLNKWARYLLSDLPDPKNQLCTDDFTGASAHNVNLAAKGIIGVAAYADLLRRSNRSEEAKLYQEKSSEFATWWQNHALAESGDHYKCQFSGGGPEDWRMQYNLPWQYFLGLDVFPRHVIETEIKYYSKHSLPCGVALVSRGDKWATVGKVDVGSWMTAISDDEYWEENVNVTFKYANEQLPMAPLSDIIKATDCTRYEPPTIARPVFGAFWGRALVAKREQQNWNQVQETLEVRAEHVVV